VARKGRIGNATTPKAVIFKNIYRALVVISFCVIPKLYLVNLIIETLRILEIPPHNSLQRVGSNDCEK